MSNFSLVNNSSSSASQTSLASTSTKLNKTLQRLSSGLRINRSGDDAAGLAIANSFRSDVSILSQGVRNANDGLSTLQIIDGGLNTISGLLDRAASLAAQSASGTFAGDRDTLQAELSKVLTEVSRQAQNIGLGGAAATPEGKYNTSIGVYIGGGATAAATGNEVVVDLSSSRVDTTGLAIGAIDIGATAGVTGAKAAIAAIKAAVVTLGGVQGKVGAGQNNLGQAIDLATAQITNFQAAESAIRDADVAQEASNMARLATLQQAGVSALAQANQSSQALLSLLR
jgi:flagellin